MTNPAAYYTWPTMEQLSIVVSRQFGASPAAVFDAWLDAESAAQFLFATPGGVMVKVEINPRVGGGFVVVERRGDASVEHYGTFVALDRPRLLAFDFRAGAEPAATRVTVTFDAVEDACLVTLTHHLDAAWAKHEQRVRAGWMGILEALGRTLRA